MLAKPEPARYIVLGLILIGLMILARTASSASAGWRSMTASTARRRGAMGVLELHKVSLAFGGLAVVDGLDLDIEEGSIVSRDRAERRRQDDALQPDHRHLRPRLGRHQAGRPEHRRACSRTRSPARGISRTFQTLRLFLNMSVKENVMAAAYCHTKAGLVPFDAAHAGHAQRGARDRGARRGSGSRSSASG